MSKTKSTRSRATHRVPPASDDKAPQEGTVVAFPGDRKVAVAKVICGATGLNPTQAKQKIERLPATFLALLSNSALAEDLAAIGAVVTVEPVATRPDRVEALPVTSARKPIAEALARALLARIARLRVQAEQLQTDLEALRDELPEGEIGPVDNRNYLVEVRQKAQSCLTELEGAVSLLEPDEDDAECVLRSLEQLVRADQSTA